MNEKVTELSTDVYSTTTFELRIAHVVLLMVKNIEI
jgi:hypothetical protein